MILMPMVLLGSFLGVLINIVTPSVIILMLLCALLAFVTVKTSFNGIAAKKKEDEAFAKKKAEESKK